MTHDEMMSLLANTLADAAGHAGCLPILDCFSPHPGEEVTVSIPMCDDTVDIVLEDLDFPHEWEELLENSGADTMGDLVDYLCYCSQNNISLAISPEDEEKLYQILYVICNFRAKELNEVIPEEYRKGVLLISNYAEQGSSLKPYEARIYLEQRN